MGIPVDILDDLISRFLVNIPVEDRSHLTKICFQLEQAHWFYLDFDVHSDRMDVSECGFREFAHQMFSHCPFLQPFQDEADAAIENWRKHKARMPTCGAVLLNAALNRVLLVQGYYSKASWGFPKGKLEENEPMEAGAIREVYEEIGFDITPLLSPNDFFELQLHESVTRLYVISGAPEDFSYAPRTRNEILKIQWFPLDDLPLSRVRAFPV